MNLEGLVTWVYPEVAGSVSGDFTGTGGPASEIRNLSFPLQGPIPQLSEGT